MYQLEGLPRNLAYGRDTHSDLFKIVGAVNREMRKTFTKKMRKLAHPPKSASDDEIIAMMFSSQNKRFETFWRDPKKFVAFSGNKEELVDHYGFSILHSLLALYEPRTLGRPYSERVINEMREGRVPIDSQIEHLKSRLGDKFNTEWLGFLAIWPSLLADLKNWDVMNEDRRVDIANAVFAIASAMDTPYFLETAALSQPELAHEFYPLLKGNNIDDVVTGLAEMMNNLTDADNWSRMLSRLEVLLVLMRESGPSKKLVADLRDVVTELEALAIPEGVPLEEFLAKVDALFAEYLVDQGDFAALLSDIHQIVARWKLLGHEADESYRGALLDELTSRTTQAEPARDKYRAADKVLKEIVAACEEIQRGMSSATLARKRELRGDLKQREAERDAADEELTRCSYEILSALNYKGEAFEGLNDWIAELAQRFPSTAETSAADSEAPVRGEVEEDDRADEGGVKRKRIADAIAEVLPKPTRPMPQQLQQIIPGPVATILTPVTGISMQEKPISAVTMDADVPVAPVGQLPQSDAPAAVAITAETEQPVDPIPTTTPAQAAADEAVREKFWHLVAKGQYGLAHHLTVSTGMAGIPTPNATRLLVLGTGLLFPLGALARAMEDAAIEIDPANDLGGLDEDETLAANLLLVASTVRAALLAPGTGAGNILDLELSLGAGWDNLYQLTRIVSQASTQLHGMTLGPDTFRKRQAIKSIESRRKQLKEEVEEWLDANGKSSLSFQAATNVWHQWVGRSGRIYDLLLPILDPQQEMNEEWRKELSSLSDPDEVEELVQSSDRALRGNRFGNIDYHALDQLQRRVAEAIQMVHRWIALEDAKPGGRGDYIDRCIRKLDQDLESNRDTVFAEIDAAIAKTPSFVVRCAAQCVKRELQGLYGLLAPEAEACLEEPSVAHLFGMGLFLLPGIHADLAGNPESSADEVRAAILAIPQGGIPPGEAVLSKMDEGDFAAAEKLLAQVANPESIGYAPRLEEARVALKRKHDETAHFLESGFRSGLVSDNDRDRLVSDLMDIATQIDRSLRIDAMRRSLDAIVALVREKSAERMAELRKRFADLKLEDQDPRRIAIEELIEKGDALAAEEYLDHVARGEMPPSSELPADDDRAFAKFVQSLPATFILGDVETALAQGVSWGPLAGADMSANARADARALVAAWSAVKRLRKVRSEPVFDAVVIRDLLGAIGFRIANSNDVTRSGPHAQNRLETLVRAAMIADRRVCPVPEFGSEARGSYRVVILYPSAAELDPTEVSPLQRSSHAATIVLFMGALSREGRKKLLAQNLQARRSWLVIDEVVMLFLAAQEQGRLRAMFSATLPYTITDPYRIKQGGIVPAEMFFGRSAEHDAVISPTGVSQVYGGRQLGKTVLLRETERLLHDPKAHSIVQWVDLPGHNVGRSCRPETLWTIIVRELHRYGVVQADWPDFRETDARHVATVIEDIRNWIESHPEGRILLLLDEADEFLKEEAAEDYPVTRQLKALMERTGGRFKSVFVGLHNVLRSTRAPNNPLVHLGSVEIGPLYARGESRAAFEMVRGPLAALGFKFADDSLILRILAQCNYYPNLIGIFGRRLLEKLRNRADVVSHDPLRGPYVITERIVSETYEQTALRDDIRHYFLLTLELDPRYELIANWLAMEYLQKRMASSDGLESRMIRMAARQLWPEGFRATTDEEFDTLLMEMVGLGVLRRTNGTHFSFRNPNVLQLMGTPAEIDDRLTKIAVEGEIKAGFDPSSFRGPATQSVRDPQRGPLTIMQENRASAQENGVVIVCGAALSGLGILKDVLISRTTISQLICTAALSADLAEKDLDALRSKPKPGVNLMIIPESRAWTIQWVDVFGNNLKRRVSSTSFVRAVFEAGPALLWQMAKAGTIGQLAQWTVLPLKPWSDAYLWTWLEDMNLPPQKNIRQAILRATDGRPGLIIQLHPDLDAGPRILDRVEAFEASLSNPERATAVLAGLGVTCEDMRKGLGVIKELSGEKSEEFQRFWDDMGAREVALPDFLCWADYLSLIRPAGQDRWEIEPFVGKLLDVPA